MQISCNVYIYCSYLQYKWTENTEVGTLYMSGGIVQPRNSTPVTEVWPYEAGAARRY